MATEDPTQSSDDIIKELLCSLHPDDEDVPKSKYYIFIFIVFAKFDRRQYQLFELSYMS